MKHLGILLLTALFYGQYSQANEVIKYTCTPLKPTTLISKVTLNSTDRHPYGYTLILEKFDNDGAILIQSGAAEYYDDMTYFGYASESLHAAIQFDDPQDFAPTLYLNREVIWMDCQEF